MTWWKGYRQHRKGGTPGWQNTARVSSVPAGASGPRALHAHPNPFSPDGDGVDDIAQLRYRLRSEAAMVRVTLFDLEGRVVRVLSDVAFSGDDGYVIWDGSNARGNPAPAGTYVVLLEALSADGARSERHKGLVSLYRP